MKLILRRRQPPPEARDGQPVTLTAARPFRLAGGHPMRAAPCLICQLPAGGELLTIAGVVGLAGMACRCGSLPGEHFLVHASHLPLARGETLAAVASAVRDSHPHDWDMAP